MSLSVRRGVGWAGFVCGAAGVLIGVAWGGAAAVGRRPEGRSAAAARVAAVALPSTAAIRLLPSPRLAARAHAYGWPLRPFDRPHAIRGGFGDPRFGAVQRNFHFGLDLPAAGGTPVYAVAAGTVLLEPDRVDVVTRWRHFRPWDGFAYWHTLPGVRGGTYVRLHALLGWVNPLWGHLHFSEIEHGRYVNPLRPGALTPPPPPFLPAIASVAVAPTAEGALSATGFRGRVAIVVDAYARPPLELPAPWQHAVVAPSLIRWRLLAGGVPRSHWQTAADFRNYIPPNALYHDIYAPGTRPDIAGHAGTFLYYLARDWNLATLAPGAYTIEVEAFGTGGAATFATSALPVLGDAPALQAAGYQALRPRPTAPG